MIHHFSPPFEPQSMKESLARWPMALSTTYEPESVRFGYQRNPCFHREHIFDFANGVRMIAHIEVYFQPEPRRFLCLSFGVCPGNHPTINSELELQSAASILAQPFLDAMRKQGEGPREP